MTSHDHTEHITFVPVTSSDAHIDALYSLLAQRQYNISHHELPAIEEHRTFVASHPYRAWYLIKLHAHFIGTAYLTDQNTIGVSILGSDVQAMMAAIRFVSTHHDPLPAIRSVRPANFHVNVPTGDLNLQKALTELGAIIVQTTYRLSRQALPPIT
jgi:hypothetical protein